MCTTSKLQTLFHAYKTQFDRQYMFHIKQYIISISTEKWQLDMVVLIIAT